MNLRVVGVSHRGSSLGVLERLSLSPQQTRDALTRFRQRHPDVEAVLLSTCNRVEFYSAGDGTTAPSHDEVIEFLAGCRDLPPSEIADHLFQANGQEAIEHLFRVVCSLDSMVVGEAQILSQVKTAYEQANDVGSTGPLTHEAFQAALRVAKRVANETRLHQRRTSIPSVAVGDFAAAVFERFDNKCNVLIGAGEMGEETLQYLIDQGARDIRIVNRGFDRAQQLAARLGGVPQLWEDLPNLLIHADLIVSATGAEESIISLADFERAEKERSGRPLFVLDLAMPRDFDPAIGECENVYLYGIGDLEKAAEANRAERAEHVPDAERIVAEETHRFLVEFQHRATAPTIRQLKQQAAQLRDEELNRLMNKLGPVENGMRDDISRSFDRLINKLLHPPLESLRDQAHEGSPHRLLKALKELFRLKD
jgi:glutamyl-tRNA reductase